MGNAGRYRFDDLGWLQFERLCLALLDGEHVRWEERDFGRVGMAPDGVAVPSDAARLAAPTLVVVAFVRPSRRWRRRRPPELQRLVTSEADRAPVRSLGSILVLTNADEAVRGVSAPLVQLGPERLAELVDADSGLRLRVPSILGVGDPGRLIAPEVAARSTADVDAASALAPVFVPTRAYARALDVLLRRRFSVLTGPPEMGKTAIARMIALARMTDGWEAHECIRPEDLWRAFARDRAQVFVADDAFGSTEYRPDAAERWALELDRVLRALDDRHWLIWTSRPAPLRAGLGSVRREHGLERFPQPAEVQVDAAALAVDERALILFRHAKAARLPERALDVVRTHGWSIVNHPHFTPERTRRFVAERLLPLAAARGLESGALAAAVAAEIREPTEAMAASFAALAPEHRAALVALLDAPPGPVPERDFAAAARRHSGSGLSRTHTELVDRLTDHFVRVVPPSAVAWVHPSWRDLVIAELARDAAARRRFLEQCGLEGMLLAVSVAGGVAGERALPLLVDDADWDLLAARLEGMTPELDEPAAIRLLGSLAAALDADVPERAGHELAALAERALETAAAAWNGCRVAPAVGALESWLALAARVPDPPAAPQLARTWFELVPTDAVDLGSRDELARFDEWLALVEVLGRLAPDELDRLRFPEAQRHILDEFVRAAATAPAETEELVAQALNRVRRVAPDQAPAAFRAKRALEQHEEPWFEVRFETNPRRPEPAPVDRELVARVLRDLG
ncbi:MAG: hypothetical protein ICV64_03055 [Thermoleophilia bacterium]|nr:hypothetical protein [Thermoleophilia bacterium]